MILQKLASEIVDGDEKTLDIFSLTVRGLVNEFLMKAQQALSRRFNHL